MKKNVVTMAGAAEKANVETHLKKNAKKSFMLKGVMSTVVVSALLERQLHGRISGLC